MSKNTVINFGAVAVILVFGYFVFVGQGGVATETAKEKVAGPWKHDTFAKCLTEKGVQMYGSITCATCAKQRKLFGDSMQYISEIECNPRYPHPQTERCIAKKIEHTPTWIIELPDQSEVKRLEPGLRSFEELAAFSGCPYAEDKI